MLTLIGRGGTIMMEQENRTHEREVEIWQRLRQFQ